MMAGNHNWWSINGMHPQFVNASNSSMFSDSEHLHHQIDQDVPVRSWSQLLLRGMSGNEEENRFSGNIFQENKKMEHWEDEVLNLNPSFKRDSAAEVKTETSSCQFFSEHSDYDHHHHYFQANNISQTSNSNWHHQIMPVSSPTSCITSLSNSLLNFSGGKSAVNEVKNHRRNQEQSSECNNGGVSKKARVHPSSSQPALKIRKEKLGDRITALHQIVSPFGKTDTASVLSEAIGYIRFLQAQIQALSSPYMRNVSGNASVEEETPNEVSDHNLQAIKDLKSRGLCLVPISYTQHVGNDSIADYWTPSLGAGF